MSIKVRKLSKGQKALLETFKSMCFVRAVEEGKTYEVFSGKDLQALLTAADEYECSWELGNDALLDQLTQAQVDFAVRQEEKCFYALQAKLARALADHLLPRLSAWESAEALEKSVKHGYVPTLRREREQDANMALLHEALDVLGLPYCAH